MIRAITILSILIIAGSLFHGVECPGGKVYKWVDENGVVHFSDRKPDRPDRVKGTLEEREVKDSLPVEPGREKSGRLQPRSPIEYATNCTFTIKGAKSLGTGFFVSSSGYAVTCRHVVEEETDPKAQLNDQEAYQVRVLSTSPHYDLALLLVLAPHNPPRLTLRDPGTLVPGERLYAIGTSAGLQATITDGVFTGFRRIKSTREKVIQFSAPINQGNSGGPLIDERGRLVGVVTWKYLEKAGIPVSGVGFAIPSNRIAEEYGSYVQ